MHCRGFHAPHRDFSADSFPSWRRSPFFATSPRRLCFRLHLHMFLNLDHPGPLSPSLATPKTIRPLVRESHLGRAAAGDPPRSFTIHDRMIVRAPFKTRSLRFEWETTNPIPPAHRKERDERGTASTSTHSSHRLAAFDRATASRPLTGPRNIKGRPFLVSCGCCAEQTTQAEGKEHPDE